MSHLVSEMLKPTGVEIDGPHPWDIQVNDDRFYKRILKGQSLGLGEAYMEGWWDCPKIDEMIYRLLKTNIYEEVKGSPKLLFHILLNRFFNMQSHSRAGIIAEKHYNLGNAFYQTMLGSTMNYSCGYWEKAHTLDEAQYAKMDLICRKLMLKPNMKLLDIGCGWGDLAKYAAEKYGAQVVGITVSKPQMEKAKERCQGLNVEFRLMDYRDLPKTESFDRVVSVGMFEHVGYKNYRTFMEVAHRSLKQDGIFLLHTIGGNTSVTYGDPWITKYIFPNGMIPSIPQISTAFEDLFIMEDWHNFGADYDKTLMAWYHNFSTHWHSFKPQYGDTFHRMWTYYLLSCAGAFRARSVQLWQIVLTKHGLPNGFHVRS